MKQRESRGSILELHRGSLSRSDLPAESRVNRRLARPFTSIAPSLLHMLRYCQSQSLVAASRIFETHVG